MVGPHGPVKSKRAMADFATEVAFNSLLSKAAAQGLDITPVVGLMYLPEQALTRQFQEACRNILASLGATELIP